MSSLAPNSLKQTFLKGVIAKERFVTEQHVWREEIRCLGFAFFDSAISITNISRGASAAFQAACSDDRGS